MLTYIELLEEAARYLELLERADAFGDDDEDEQSPETEADADPAQEDSRGRPAWQRSLDLAPAAGFVLRMKAEGWKRFCERIGVPPFVLWEALPGFDRLHRAVALTEKVAFVPEGFLRWLNAVRPAGDPELSEIPLTTEGVADAADRTL